MIKAGKPVDVIPHLFICSMENMGTVSVDFNPLHFFRINIPGNVIPFVNDKDFSAFSVHLIRKYGTEQPGADNQIIILHYCSTA